MTCSTTSFFFFLSFFFSWIHRHRILLILTRQPRSFLGCSFWFLLLCSLFTLGIFQGLIPASFLTPPCPFGQLVHNQGFNSYPGTNLKGKPASQTSLWSSRLVMPAAYLTFLTFLPLYLIGHTTVNKDITQFIIFPTRPVPPPVFPTQDALFILYLRLET